MKSFHLEYIFRKIRKSDWGEICVAIDARSSVIFALILLLRTAELCDTENRIESNSPIYLFIFFFFQRTDEEFRKNIYYVRSNLARIITFSSFMFIPRPLLHPQDFFDTSFRGRTRSFDRRVCNSNRSSVAGTIFNETSVTFAYRDIQFCEAAKNKGSRRRKEAEVAVGGHAIK